jgi:DNA-binding transcriptional MocR family regulator
VRGEVGRGTFVRSIQLTTETPWPEEDSGKALVDMRSNFPCSMAEDSAFKEAFEKLSRHADLDKLLQYQPGSTAIEHLDAGATWLQWMGLDTSVERIVMTNGALHAGFLALMATTNPGDVILTEELTSPTIRGIAAMLHLRLVGVLMDKKGMIPEALKEHARRKRAKALYVTPNLQNPTTAILSDSRRL